jgi:hypothetical protein
MQPMTLIGNSGIGRFSMQERRSAERQYTRTS